MRAAENVIFVSLTALGWLMNANYPKLKAYADRNPIFHFICKFYALRKESELITVTSKMIRNFVFLN